RAASAPTSRTHRLGNDVRASLHARAQYHEGSPRHRPPDVPVGRLAAPDVTRIAGHLRLRALRPGWRMGPAKMNDADARLFRQQASRLRGTQRVFFLAQMPDHQNVEPAPTTRTQVAKRCCGLIDDLKLPPVAHWNRVADERVQPN